MTKRSADGAADRLIRERSLATWPHWDWEQCRPLRLGTGPRQFVAMSGAAVGSVFDICGREQLPMATIHVSGDWPRSRELGA